MRERWERLLAMVCGALLILIAFRVFMVVKKGPLSGLNIPPLPHYVDTNAVANVGKTNGPAKTASNKTPAGTNNTSTNTASAKTGTNASGALASAAAATNTVATNKPTASSTNAMVATVPPGTNSGTNVPTANGTNAVAGKGKNGTNDVKVANSGPPVVNGMPVMMSGDFPPGFPGGPGMQGGANKLPDLPPLAQGRVNKIIVSEIFAPMMHPQPSDLMGIAGNYAFLRASSGAMGMVKEGDSLGGLKLLKVGINRVLIEEDGEKKELMIYQGYGSESLMTQNKETKENTNDIPRKSH